MIDWEGIAGLDAGDELKIVCADRVDYEWARDLVRAEERLPAGVPVLLSPVQGRLEPRVLAARRGDDTTLAVLVDDPDRRVRQHVARLFDPIHKHLAGAVLCHRTGVRYRKNRDADGEKFLGFIDARHVLRCPLTFLRTRAPCRVRY